MGFLPIFLVVLAFILNPLEIQCKNIGFTTDLIHRDSLKATTNVSLSSISRFENIRKAILRSFSRAAYFEHAQSGASVIDSPVKEMGFEYLMQVSIGTPPVVINAIVDTGSDMTWTQCKPCKNCFKQDDPLFDPTNTSSYQQLSCTSSLCKSTFDAQPCDHSNKCTYQIIYANNFTTIGDLALETLTFSSGNGEAFSFPNIAFGCGHESKNNFSEGASGIVGLSEGSLSIINQLSLKLRKKFSYCLVPIEKNVSSKISFGVDSIAPGSGAISTPLIKPKTPYFYFISLEAISVGDSGNASQRISVEKTIPGTAEVNIIVDSGTTGTAIPTQLFDGLLTTLKNSIKANPVPDQSGTLGLCYKVDPNLKFPQLVFHFKDADLMVSPDNIFIEFNEGVACLTIFPSDGTYILGNLAQMNFVVEFDLENSKLSFLPTDCTKMS